MSNGGSTLTSIARTLSELIKDESKLDTRGGQIFILSLLSEGFVEVGNMDTRLKEMEQAYIRFTNLNNDLKNIEEENKNKVTAMQTQINSLYIEVLPDIKQTLKVLKWIGGIATFIIGSLLLMIITGQLQLVRP